MSAYGVYKALHYSLSKHQSCHYHVFPRCLSKQVGTKDEKRIKPPSGLIDTFRDKITGKRCLKQVLVLEGVVRLSIRHATRLKPTIENFFYALEIALSLL